MDIDLTETVVVSHQFIAMGGPCHLHFYGNKSELDNAFAACQHTVETFQNKYSRYDSASILSQINQNAGQPTSVDEETAAILNYADHAYELSDGLFDITSGIMRLAWDFKQQVPPTQKVIDELLPRIGWDKVRWNGETIHLQEGMQIDLGGIVKEYAADSVAALARANGIKSGYVDLGGDIAIIGPHIDGSPWNVGIRDPDAPEQVKATIKVLEGGVASSGDYERFFHYQGKRYCHIINPKTGWPAQGVAGVSVMAPLCVFAGTLSTIALLKGPIEGRTFLEECDFPFVMFERTGE